MNISSANSATAMLGRLSSASTRSQSSTPINESVRSLDVNKAQGQPSKGVTPEIVIDEQAIEQFKENQTSPLAFSQSNNAKFSPADQDQPSAKNEIAVAHYQAIGNLSERESVQKLFGVDLLA
jgi:hypothetical protein